MKKLFENWRRFAEQEEPQDTTLPQDTGPTGQSLSGELDIESDFKKGNWGYVFGTTDGDILGRYNENKLFYGASSPKPILALANLTKCSLNPEEGRCLSTDELRALLNYAPERDSRGKPKKSWHRHDSNKVNRALSRTGPRGKDRADGTADDIRRVGKELANFKNNEEALKFLKQLGLPDMKIRYGTANNKQTPLGYYNFLKFILNPEEAKMPGVSSAAQEILNYMRRDHGVDIKDREFNKRFEGTRKYLNAAGIPIQKIYGKGGFARVGSAASTHASNSGMIIDDQYILAIFTGSLLHKNKKSGFKSLNDIIVQILKNSGAF